MLTLPKIAVTGGLSCGKSSTCHYFKELGAYVVSSDDIVHQLLSPATNLGQQVVNLIGPDIVVNHQIDRSLIAKKVFQNPKLLKSLEQILHPAVGIELEKLYQRVKAENKVLLFVAEIPLLFEVNGSQFFTYDYSVAVIADPDICKSRFQKVAGSNKDEYQARANRQLSLEEKAQKADYVIVNNGTLQDLREAVAKIFKLITLQDRSQNTK